MKHLNYLERDMLKGKVFSSMTTLPEVWRVGEELANIGPSEGVEYVAMAIVSSSEALANFVDSTADGFEYIYEQVAKRLLR